MKPETEERWRQLAICAVIAGKSANIEYTDWSASSIVADAIYMADTLVKKLKDEEEKEATTKQ